MAQRSKARLDKDRVESGVTKREAFTVGYVRGVTPTKWARIWNVRRPDLPLKLVATDDDQVEVLRDGRARMAFVRLPIDRVGLNTISLYTETAVAVVPKEHVIATLDEIENSDLHGERIHEAGPVEDTLAMVAAGVGVAVIPQSIARLHARRDLIYRPITDAEPTDIVLAWVADDQSLDATERAAVQDFIGIVRGRTAHSSRGNADAAPTSKSTKAAQAAKAQADKKSKPPTKGRGAVKSAVVKKSVPTTKSGVAKKTEVPKNTGGVRKTGGAKKSRSTTKTGAKQRNGRKP